MHASFLDVLCCASACHAAHLLGDADAPAYCAITSAAPGDVWNGDCGAEPAAGVCLSPDMNLNILLPGATGDLKASLLRAGLSVGDGTGDLEQADCGNGAAISTIDRAW